GSLGFHTPQTSEGRARRMKLTRFWTDQAWVRFSPRTSIIPLRRLKRDVSASNSNERLSVASSVVRKVSLPAIVERRLDSPHARAARMGCRARKPQLQYPGGAT